MSYITPHSKVRFIERVNVNLPKKRKQKDKFINDYLKKAYNNGTSINHIKDDNLRHYMLHKLKSNTHSVQATKVTLYNNNIFLFYGRQCITILEVPEKMSDNDDCVIGLTNLKKYIDKLKVNKNVKKWLYDNSFKLESNKSFKKIIIKDLNMTYSTILNKFPTNAIDYIKNDSELRNIIIKTNKKRNNVLKQRYYIICSLLLLLFPKNEIVNIQNLFKKKRCGFIDNSNPKKFTQKQIDICYKQLSILLGYSVKPKFKDFLYI